MHAFGLGDLVGRIREGYTERTPSGGLHLLYRVPTPAPNTKLAERPATQDELARAASLARLARTRALRRSQTLLKIAFSP